ncbi:MAG TPA: four helix bundle protein [Bacteroidota bacterium]|nr:four helix bundle protein [Bacteroidota bacterium]
MLLGKDNNLYSKSLAFAVRIVKLYRWVAHNKREFILSKQILRSGTSIGANVAEANGAISIPDFSSKISISYKEALETKYWLTLLRETKLIDLRLFNSLYADVDELSKILFTILKRTRFRSN